MLRNFTFSRRPWAIFDVAKDSLFGLLRNSFRFLNGFPSNISAGHLYDIFLILQFVSGSLCFPFQCLIRSGNGRIHGRSQRHLAVQIRGLKLETVEYSDAVSTYELHVLPIVTFSITIISNHLGETQSYHVELDEYSFVFHSGASFKQIHRTDRNSFYGCNIALKGSIARKCLIASIQSDFEGRERERERERENPTMDSNCKWRPKQMQTLDWIQLSGIWWLIRIENDNPTTAVND